MTKILNIRFEDSLDSRIKNESVFLSDTEYLACVGNIFEQSDLSVGLIQVSIQKKRKNLKV